MENKRRLPPHAAGLASAALVVAIAGAACSRPPIKIGVPLVLTGISSRRGVAARNGIQLAADEANAAGGVAGRRLELLVRDDRDDASLAADTDFSLINAGVVAIVGHISDSAAREAIEVANERSVPILSPTIDSPEYSGKDDCFFRLCGSSDRLGWHLGAWAAGAGHRAVAVAALEGEAGFTGAFRAAFEAGGGRITIVRELQTSPRFDYGSLAESLLDSKPDAILSSSVAFDTASLCQALARRKAIRPVLAPPWSMSDDLFVFGGRTVEGVAIASYFDPDCAEPAYLDFLERYRVRYGEAADAAATAGYDAMRYLIASIGAARRIEAGAIREAMLALGTYRTLQGEVRMDRYGDVEREPLVCVSRNGRFARTP